MVLRWLGQSGLKRDLVRCGRGSAAAGQINALNGTMDRLRAKDKGVGRANPICLNSNKAPRLLLSALIEVTVVLIWKP